MKLSFFTFLRDPCQLGYPYLESIQSALPLADEFIIALADGRDSFESVSETIRDLKSPKIRVVRTSWNESMRTAGFVYGQQKMLAQSYCQGDFAFYLEADEVLHEDCYDYLDHTLRKSIINRSVEALAFNYLHFFGTSDWVANSPGWYRYAPRIIRNDLRAVALDGLFWNVVRSNQRLRWPRAKVLDASIYHYGHIRSLAANQEKQNTVQKYWNKNSRVVSEYQIHPQFLKKFEGAHPQIMSEWIDKKSNKNFEPFGPYVPTSRDKRHLALMRLEKLFNVDFSKKHFQRVG